MFLVRMHQNTVLQRAYKFIKFSVGNFILLHNKMYSFYRQFIFSVHISSSSQLGNAELPMYEDRMRVPGKVDQGNSQIRSGHLTNLVRLLPQQIQCEFSYLHRSYIWMFILMSVWNYLLYFCISFDIFFSKIHLKIRMSL